jgi:hypothetical protein
MATIPGSHFDATAAQPMNVVETTTGTGLPSPVAGDFNLEVFVGSRFSSSAPTQPAPGYDGLAILAPSGAELDLITGAYAVTDFGDGFDTLSAYGDNETITGVAPRVTMNVYGSQDTANVGDQDTLSIFGTNDTTNVTGNSQVFDYTDHQTMTAGAGTHFFKLANFVSLTLGSGGDAVYTAENDTIMGGTGNDTVNLIGQHNLYIGGANAASTSFIWDGGDGVFNNTIVGGAGAVTIVAHTAGGSITAGSGNDTVYVFTDDDTIAGGSGNMMVSGLGADDSITGGTDPAGADVSCLSMVRMAVTTPSRVARAVIRLM